MIKFFHIIINIKPIMNISKTIKYLQIQKKEKQYSQTIKAYHIFQYKSNDSQFGSQYSY